MHFQNERQAEISYFCLKCGNIKYVEGGHIHAKASSLDQGREGKIVHVGITPLVL